MTRRMKSVHIWEPVPPHDGSSRSSPLTDHLLQNTKPVAMVTGFFVEFTDFTRPTLKDSPDLNR